MFNAMLRSVVEEVPGSIGAVLMGYDGIAIATHLAAADENPDLQMLAIEYANILKEIRNASAVLNTGELEEVDIRTERYCFVLRAVSEEYFVALALTHDGNFGKGRYLLRRDIDKLREALL